MLRTPASSHTCSSAPGPCLSHIPPTRLPDYNMEDLELVMARNSLANPQEAVLILINSQCHYGNFIMKCTPKQNKTKQSKTKKQSGGWAAGCSLETPQQVEAARVLFCSQESGLPAHYPLPLIVFSSWFYHTWSSITHIHNLRITRGIF